MREKIGSKAAAYMFNMHKPARWWCHLALRTDNKVSYKTEVSDSGQRPVYLRSALHILDCITVLPNIRDGMTKFISEESTDNFWTNLVQKYWIMCAGINLRFF